MCTGEAHVGKGASLWWHGEKLDLVTPRPSVSVFKQSWMVTKRDLYWWNGGQKVSLGDWTLRSRGHWPQSFVPKASGLTEVLCDKAITKRQSVNEAPRKREGRLQYQRLKKTLLKRNVTSSCSRTPLRKPPFKRRVKEQPMEACQRLLWINQCGGKAQGWSGEPATRL
jgi:hypothetical protein